MERFADLTPTEYEDLVDKIVHTENIPYGEAYTKAEQIAGPPPYELASIEPEKVPVQRKVGGEAVHASRGGSSRGPVSEDEGVGYDNNLPHYYQAPPQFTEAAAADHHAHVTAIKEMLENKKRAKQDQ